VKKMSAHERKKKIERHIREREEVVLENKNVLYFEKNK
jgi:hypothetical protein